MLPPPCLIAGTLVLGVKASRLLIQTYLLSLWLNSLIFVLSDHKSFLHKAFCSFMWASANFSWAWTSQFWKRDFLFGQHPCNSWPYKTGFTVDSRTVKAVSISQQAWALVVPRLSLNILPNFLSSERKSLDQGYNPGLEGLECTAGSRSHPGSAHMNDMISSLPASGELQDTLRR